VPDVPVHQHAHDVVPGPVLIYTATCLAPDCGWTVTGGQEVDRQAERHTKPGGHPTITTMTPTKETP
jgi:hypothetical protein